MPFDIPNLSAVPDKISLPGLSDVSSVFSGTTGIKLRIEYTLSPLNDIRFSNSPDPKKIEKSFTIGTRNNTVTERLQFAVSKKTGQQSFFITINYVNTANNATKVKKIQIELI